MTSTVTVTGSAARAGAGPGRGRRAETAATGDLRLSQSPSLNCLRPGGLLMGPGPGRAWAASKEGYRGRTSTEGSKLYSTRASYIA